MALGHLAGVITAAILVVTPVSRDVSYAKTLAGLYLLIWAAVSLGGFILSTFPGVVG